MNCSKAKKRIPFLVNSEIDERQRREVEEHLRQCAACQAIANQYAELARFARSMTKPNEPPGFYDGFLQEVLTQVSRDTPPISGSMQRRPEWLRLRPRYALVGVGALIAVVVVGLLFSRMENKNRRMTVETYLIQHDFQGLAHNLADPQQRPLLLRDSVSVDLLIESLELLDLVHRRHGQVGPYLVRVVAMILSDRQKPRAISGREQNLLETTSMHRAFLFMGKFDFKAAHREIQSLKRLSAKVTLNELAKPWTYPFRSNPLKGGRKP